MHRQLLFIPLFLCTCMGGTSDRAEANSGACLLQTNRTQLQSNRTNASVGSSRWSMMPSLMKPAVLQETYPVESPRHLLHLSPRVTNAADSAEVAYSPGIVAPATAVASAEAVTLAASNIAKAVSAVTLAAANIHKEAKEETENVTEAVTASLPMMPMMRFVEEPLMPNVTEAVTASLPMMPQAAAPSSGPAPDAALPPSGIAGLFDTMRFTVVRIQAIVAKADWLQPYKQPTDTPFIGSGFVVEGGSDDPVFLTNAHVVENAHTVQVQLPAIGQMIFEAYVPLICKRFDLAVVQLKEPKKFWEALAKANGTMHALPIRPNAVSLGLEVAAVGFPLGSSSLKLSRGIISGTEMVDGTICYQSTAPISPGSSGGPLFAVGSESVPANVSDLQVIGVNFASSVSEGAQNVNYVVPTIHLLQVLSEFFDMKASFLNTAASIQADENTSTVVAPMLSQLRPLSVHRKHHQHAPLAVASISNTQPPSNPNQPKSQPVYPHIQLRIAPVDTIGIEANDALYNTSGGCNSGVFLSRMLPTSALRFANPPVPERSFLTSVDNVTLDSFGMGRTANFLGDPTPFESLMSLREKVDDPVTLTVCQQGKETQHVVSIRWRPEYSLAVEDVEEPYFENEAMKYEIFAGITIMQMTTNHIADLLKSGRPQTLSRWLLIENQAEPRLLITDVEEGTYASRVLTPGMVVQAINGKNVSKLGDIRKEFSPTGIAWTLETDRGIMFSVKFNDALTEQVTSADSSSGKQYLLSPAPLAAAKKMKLVQRDVPGFQPEASMRGETPDTWMATARNSVPAETRIDTSRGSLAGRALSPDRGLVF